MKYDYFYFDRLYDRETCQYVSNMAKIRSDPRFIDKPAEDVKKVSDVYMTVWKNCKELLPNFEDLVSHVNNEVFGFDLYRFTGEEPIHYNEYDGTKNGQYEWHNDGTVNEMYDFKLTAIVNLSTEPYKGGEFELFLKKPNHIDALDNQGSVLIFPSYMQHRVKAVTEGVRKSITFWFRGPLLK